MNKAAENVYTSIRKNETQQEVLHTMQTREELYASINYYSYENALDRLFQNDKK
jgi:methylisocitrate lyase